MILHHHLKRGGVTRIIGLQIKSLIEVGFSKEDITVLCGHLPEDNELSEIKTIVEPELNYLYRKDSEEIEFDNHLEKLIKILKKNVSKKSVLHVHNYGLGKNPIFTVAISQMISEGYPVLNHCHDFAEDRPSNMDYLEAVISDHFKKHVTDVLYPIKKNLMYGVINRSDRERLYESGIPEEDVQYVPNPVDPKEFTSAIEKKNTLKESICKNLNVSFDKKIVTYPIRVIRRKNIEEILLLSILFKEKAAFLVTLAPENPIEIEYYKYWKEFSEKHNLPVIFDVGNRMDFRDLLAGSDFCISTSVMEGFGMTFLEPWLTSTPVIGRDLPFVTSDFKRMGILFVNLYKNIIIRSENNRDFKDLNQNESTTFLSRLIDSKEEQNLTFDANPDLCTLFNEQESKIIEHNRKTIIENFSLVNYGNKLNEIYKSISK